MLQELVAQSGASHWAVGSLLFFLAIFLYVVGAGVPDPPRGI